MAQHAAPSAAFRGAFLTGSVLARRADEVPPPWSDVDVLVVVEGPAPPKPGKLVHDGVLLDVAHVPSAELLDPLVVAGCYHLAPSFAGGPVDAVLADPTGHLGALRERITPGFSQPDAVLRRCEDVLARMTSRLRAPDPAAGWHEQVLAWVFPASLATQVPLVAAGELPTVRRRYAAAGAVLRRHGREPLYERLLEVLGCAGVDPGTVQRHLDSLTGVFDTAAGAARTRFPFSGDLTAAARAVAVDGSQHLVDRGAHREAAFWVVVTLARCQHVLAVDASPGAREDGARRFAAAAAELLGLRTAADLAERVDAARGLVPALRESAAAIVETRLRHGGGPERTADVDLAPPAW